MQVLQTPTVELFNKELVGMEAMTWLGTTQQQGRFSNTCVRRPKATKVFISTRLQRASVSSLLMY